MRGLERAGHDNVYTRKLESSPQTLINSDIDQSGVYQRSVYAHMPLWPLPSLSLPPSPSVSFRPFRPRPRPPPLVYTRVVLGIQTMVKRAKKCHQFIRLPRFPRCAIFAILSTKGLADARKRSRRRRSGKRRKPSRDHVHRDVTPADASRDVFDRSNGDRRGTVVRPGHRSSAALSLSRGCCRHANYRSAATEIATGSAVNEKIPRSTVHAEFQFIVSSHRSRRS